MSSKSKAILLGILVLCATAMLAQEITGTIAGNVSDPTGATVPNAKITVTNIDQKVVVRSVTTNSNGAYSVPLLPVGNYSVTAEAPGFKTYTTTKIQLNLNDKLTINLPMQVGQTNESVTVEAQALQVETQSAAAGGLITGTQVRELSLNNRNYIQLLSLMPGVSSTQSDQFYVGLTNPLSGGFNTLGISVNGQRTSGNNWTVDGADNVDRGSNLGLLTTPSIDSIGEVKVLRANYDAEYGRSGASQVNVVTRSGTNSYHGSAYEFWRNNLLNADSYFNKKKRTTTPGLTPNSDTRLPLRYHNFGYTIGGPVTIPGLYNSNRDKTFFFFSEEFRRVITYSTAVASVPTGAELGGTFTNPVCILDNTGKCTNVFTTQLTAAQISPTAAAYVKDIWSRTPSSTDVLTHSLTNSFRTLSNFREESAKIDHVFGPKLTVYGRYLHDSIPTTEPQGLFSGTPLPGVADTASNSPGWSLVGRATATLTPNLLLEGGYNYSYGAILSNVTGLLNPANSPDIHPNTVFPLAPGRLPSILFSGAQSNIGSFGPYFDYNRNHQGFGNATWVRGSHTLKFGGTYYHYQKSENGNGGNAGSFNFDNTGAPAGSNASVSFQQSWANFLQGRSTAYTQASEDLYVDINANQFEMYGQDEWRIRPNLTLNYGVRYSLFRQPTEATNRLTNFDPAAYDPAKAPTIDTKGNVCTTAAPCAGGVLPNPNFDPLNGIIISGKNSPYGNKVSNEELKDFAPRFGIAWDPYGQGKTSIRSGFGMFYDVPLFGITEQNVLTNVPFVQSRIFANTSLDNPLSGVPSISAAPLTVSSRAAVPWHNPYVMNYSLDVQQELPWGMIMDVGYYGNKGTHLIGLVDLNQPQPGAYITAGIATAAQGITSGTNPQLNKIRPFIGYGPMPAIRSMFTAHYNSLQTSLQKRLTGNSQFGVSYTWSHALTYNQTDRSTDPQNTYDIRSEFGPTQQDRRQVFVMNYVYEIPWMRAQQGILGHVLGGWELSGITSFETGTPLTVFGFKGSPNTDYSGQGSPFSGFTLNAQRPDQTGDPNAGAPKTFAQWFNTSVFSNVPAGQVRGGSERRGAVYGPGFERWDVSLFKNLKFTERFGGQFRAEAFNVLNHTNPSGVNTTFSSALFGTVNATRDPRIMQLGLKLNF